VGNGGRREALVRRFENQRLGVQVAVVLALSMVLLYVVHVTVLNQPSGRGLLYAVFWGVLATFFVVGSLRVERARREAGRRPASRGDEGPPEGGG
jgi:cation transport ATPase